MSDLRPRGPKDLPLVPRWVVMSLLAAAALLVATVLLHLSGAMPTGHGM
jgi:hypothetical protein